MNGSTQWWIDNTSEKENHFLKQLTIQVFILLKSFLQNDQIIVKALDVIPLQIFFNIQL